MLTVASREEAAERYPDSLGEYQLLQDITHNGHSVYQSLAEEDKYIIFIGKTLIYVVIIITSLFNKYFPPGDHWYIAQDISNTAVREMRSAMMGQVVVPELGWQYFDSDYDHSNFTDCKTVR